MSGICGSFALDGAPADPAALGAVLDGLARRGPDRSAIASNGPAALGHALNATTPESLIEAMPWRHGETGCVITADVRLDNRDTLLGQLGLDCAARVVGDGEIILHAYLRWGRDCAAHLAGDFAFAIWDPRCQHLLAARDKVGMRQFIYHHQPGKLFVFATDAEALIHHVAVPCRINEGRIADLIEGLEAIDGVSTFYQNVLQLPPAHALLIDREALTIWRYWQLEPTGIIERANDRAYEEAFLQVFTEAVTRRLRAPEGVLGSMLSGGMDSGSVVAVAARLLQQEGAPPLKTVSAIDTNPECLETRAIRALLSLPHLDPQLIPSEMPDLMRKEVCEAVRNCPEPFDGHMAMVFAVYHTAQAAGLKAMLDGLGGDTTLGSGNVVDWYLEQGRIGAAWREARADERFWGDWMPARKQFFRLARQRFIPLGMRRIWHGIKPSLTRTDPGLPRFLNHPFAQRIDFAARLARFREHTALKADASLETRSRRMVHPFIIAGRERYDRVAGSYGIEQRDPFFDPQVLEFCLTLPVTQLKDAGWPKFILRRAMAGYLPDEVRWRTGRTHVGGNFIQQCIMAAGIEDFQTIQNLLSPYLQSNRLTENFDTTGKDSALAQWDESRYLAYWLIRINHQAAALGVCYD